jgi:hemolysin III
MSTALNGESASGRTGQRRRTDRPPIQAHGLPPGFTWNYARAELLADGLVHVLGLSLAVAGTVLLLWLVAPTSSRSEVLAILVYSGCLLAMLTASAVYNLWPVSRLKWLLRRFDHSAIYLLIAGTYTPFAVQLHDRRAAAALLAILWVTAALGITLKLLVPGRFDRFSIVLCILMGWSGVLFYDQVVTSLPPSSLWLLAAGGALYTFGVIFHLWESLHFQNAIWHGFVLLAAVLHYFAVWDALAFSPS